MIHLSLEETKTLLKAALLNQGVSTRAIGTAVDGFMMDLKAGRTLSFKDVGTLQLQGQQVEQIPPTVEKGAKVPVTGRFLKPPGGAFRAGQSPQVAQSVLDEAATRHFQQNGYPRREAEVAVAIGRARKRAG